MLHTGRVDFSVIEDGPRVHVVVQSEWGAPLQCGGSQSWTLF